MQAAESRVECNPFRAHRLRESISSQPPPLCRLKLQSQLVVSRLGVSERLGKRMQSRNREQQFAQPSCIAGSSEIPLGQSFQLRFEDGRLQFRQRVCLVTPVRIEMDSLSDLRLVRIQHPPPPSRQQFRAPKTPDSDVPPGSRRPATDNGSRHLAGIFDHWQSAFLSELHHRRHIHHATMQM